MMPVASFVAAVAGAILMFWRRIIGFGRVLFRKLFRRGAPDAPAAPVTPPDPGVPGR